MAGKCAPATGPGWASKRGLISHYTAAYPAWHAQVPVAEGYALARTRVEISAHLSPELLRRLTLARDLPLPPAAEVEALLLVQSPAWSSPAHDPAFASLALALKAQVLSEPYQRFWPAGGTRLGG